MDILKIRNKINSTTRINKLTHTIKVISTARTSFFLKALSHHKAYHERLLDIWHKYTVNLEKKEHHKEGSRIFFLLMGVNKGLCAPMSGNMIKGTMAFLSEKKADLHIYGTKTHLLLKRYLRAAKITPASVCSAFYPIKSIPVIEKLVDVLYVKILSGTKVICGYTHFKNSLQQHTEIRDLIDIKENLPIALTTDKTLQTVFKKLIFSFIYLNALDNILAENGARYISMKNASETCEKIVGESTLQYNKLRQENITSELTEIMAGTTK